MVAVDDLYRPYRPKRRTRATMAREKGLEPLAKMICEQKKGFSPAAAAAEFVSEEKGVASVEEALQGASDIIAEQIADEASYRQYIRERIFREGRMVTEGREENPDTNYQMYFAYDELISKTSQGWPIDRMSLVDLTILRLAVWEILYDPSIPGSVSISEAVAITECYSDPEDKGFVNGILGTILRSCEAES